MSATDELRRMLDERGVEWESDDFSGIDRKVVYQYTYWGDGGGCCFCEPIGAEPGTLGAKCDFSVIGFTPEQAIATTLGAGTCRNVSDPPEGFLCSECGWGDFAEPSHLLTGSCYAGLAKGPRYCPNCGRKVDG